jgi:hypothetical protein
MIVYWGSAGLIWTFFYLWPIFIKLKCILNLLITMSSMFIKSHPVNSAFPLVSRAFPVFVYGKDSHEIGRLAVSSVTMAKRYHPRSRRGRRRCNFHVGGSDLCVRQMCYGNQVPDAQHGGRCVQKGRGESVKTIPLLSLDWNFARDRSFCDWHFVGKEDATGCLKRWREKRVRKGERFIH